MSSPTNRLRKSTLLGVILVLAFAGMALAGSSAVVLNYQIDFLGSWDNQDGTSLWMYALTASGDEPCNLGHWVLEVQSCYNVVWPCTDCEYTTVTEGFGCGSTYNCEQATCTVQVGVDPVTGISGLRFENCTPALGPGQPLPRTHIFQLFVDDVPVQGGDVQVGVAGLPGYETGSITGPACDPNAVRVKALTASAGRLPAGLALVAPVLALAVGAIVVARRARPR